MWVLFNLSLNAHSLKSEFSSVCFLLILKIDEVTDVGSAGQRQQLQLSGSALGAGDVVIPAGEEKDEEEVAADRRAAAAGFQGPRHMLKVYLTDGVNKVVALDTQGALAASYQQRCASVGRGGPVPSLHSFYAGAKVRKLAYRWMHSFFS